MNLKVGIVGLANVGKSTLFNAIMGRQAALTAPYPFATVEPNTGVVEVPDERLEKLRDGMFPPDSEKSAGSAKISSNQIMDKSERSDTSESDSADLSAIRSGPPAAGRADRAETPTFPKVPVVPATVTFVDIAGLVKGAAEGHGLGNQFLSHIRDVDLILHVLRDFDDPDVPRAEDSRDPEHDAEIVKTELELKDLEIAERQGIKNIKDIKDIKEGTDEKTLLSKKPTIYAINVGEEKLTPRLGGESPRFYFCAKLEEQIAQLPKNEQKEYLKIYGLKQSGLDRIISECFQALGLISFFTAGVKEVRAWPVRRDSPAPAAAGVIHSDFLELFIRAEVIGWEKLAASGSWQAAKEKGRVRTEGREYLMKDGDVVNFLIGK